MKKYRVKIGDQILMVEAEEITPEIPPVNPPPPTTNKKFFYGTNGFHWIPLEKLKPLSSIRLYLAGGWLWRPGGLFAEPIWQAEKPYLKGLDDYFAKAKAAGIDVLPCVNQTPDWYAGISDKSGSNNYPPVKSGMDRAKAESYADYADFWFQFVARYGSKTHPDSVLRVDTTPKYENQPLNVKKSGLNLISSVEIGNEFDRWWNVGTDLYLKPEEHAAMLFACYQACKRADPNIQVIMGGLTGFDLKYLQAMKAAFDRMGVKFQSDKINVHHYSNLYNEYGKWPPTWKDSSACYPEKDKDFPMIAEIVKFGKSLGLETWVTEFGCDSKAPSWMHIKGEGISDEEAQAELIVKTFEAYKVSGVERAYVFNAIDEAGSPNGGLWQNSGLLTSEATGYKEKPAMVAVKKLIEGK